MTVLSPKFTFALSINGSFSRLLSMLALQWLQVIPSTLIVLISIVLFFRVITAFFFVLRYLCKYPLMIRAVRTIPDVICNQLRPVL